MSEDDLPNVTDEFDLLYLRRRHGWSELHVVTGTNSVVAPISHIFSDPIEDLADLCSALLSGADRHLTILHDEPGSNVLLASIYPKQKHIVRIELWQCVGWNDIPPHGKLILSMDVKVRQFVGLVYRQLDKVRWLCEDKSYRQERRVSSYAAIEHLSRLLTKPT
jgi:hypothetical protein